MCAWERTTASTDFGENGKLRLRSFAAFRRPWYRPQSSRNRLPLTCTSCIDPVTVRTAPQKVIFISHHYVGIRIPLSFQGTETHRHRSFALSVRQLFTSSGSDNRGWRRLILSPWERNLIPGNELLAVKLRWTFRR